MTNTVNMMYPCRLQKYNIVYLAATQLTNTGIYVGAVVKRGPDWDWDNQDGGEEGSTATGTVTCIRGWDQESAVSTPLPTSLQTYYYPAVIGYL